jgi:hypothetical protein
MSRLVPGPLILHRHFAPQDRMAEVICGLVMVLSFTAATASIFQNTTSHALLIAILGCNISWGIVDGVTYVLGNLLNRGARSRLIHQIKSNPNDPHVSQDIASRIETVLGELLTPQQSQNLQQWIMQGAARVEPQPTRLKKEDLYTAAACFVIVFGAAIPVLLPFLLIKNEVTALRVSNGLILAMLFAIGWRWAPFANMNRVATGLGLLSLGVVLVLITVALGG